MKAYLWIIIAFGLLFRLYNFDKGFKFAHDHDLYSWIAKDIVVNGHNRLVGQVTSVDGVFIGSAHYYLMAIFYKLGGMNPLMAVVPITIIGLFTIWSFYFVIAKHFGKKAGLWAAFIYSISFGCALYDRWSVPTQPTVLWSVWFLYVLLETVKGNLKVLPLYGFLCGFVWQLHIALIPILPLPILVYVMSYNIFNIFDKKNIKFTLLSIIVFCLTILPFFMFEVKHNFSQTKAMMVGINVDKGGPTGWQKVGKVLETSGREFQQRLLFGQDLGGVYQYWLVLIMLTFILVRKQVVKLKLLLILSSWVLMIMFMQFISKRVVSEYYFTNLLPVYILILSVFLGEIKNRYVLILLSVGYLFVNLKWLTTKSDDYESYFYKMEVVNFVKKDAKANNYPCVAINFIADPGVGVGFRYLFWWQKIKLIRPGVEGIAVYNIPIPWQISQKDNPTIFGRYGVIIPPKPAKSIDPIMCDKPGNQLDPLLGYVE